MSDNRENHRRIMMLHHYERLCPRVVLVAKILQAAGYGIKAVMWCRDPEIYACHDPEQEGVRLLWADVPSPMGSSRIVLAFPALFREIWQLLRTESFDIVHCNHFFLLPLAVAIKWKRNTALVYDAYERHAADIADAYFPFGKRLVQSLIEKIENFLVRFTDGVLTISSKNEELDKRYRQWCRNVEMLNNVPSLRVRLEKPLLEKIRETYGHRRLMAYVGILVKDKGLLNLLEVLEILHRDFKDILLLLIGRFKSKAEEEDFFQRAEAKGVRQQIDFLGWMPYGQMLHYLSQAQVGIGLFQEGYVSPLLGKGTARKIFTYMQAGIPIVSTRFTEVAKVVEEEHCGILVDPSSPQEIAAAVETLLTEPTLARQMGEQGRRAILSKYNWELEERKVVGLYDRVRQVSPGSARVSP